VAQAARHRLRPPPLYGLLSDEEWALMETWYAETESGAAEINVPAMSVLQAW
jgi:hypothetical protein